MGSEIDNTSSNPLELELTTPQFIRGQYKDPLPRPMGKPLEEGNESTELEDFPNIKEPFKDSLEKISSIDDSIKPEILGFNLAVSLQGFQILAQQQIDNLDPSSPAVVFLPKFAQLYQNMLLNAGDLVGAQGVFGASKLIIDHKISQGETSDISEEKINSKNELQSSSQEKVTNAFANAVASTQGTGKIAWMAGTAYTAFLVNYWEMLSILKEMKAVDGNIQIQGMNMMVEMAKNTAEAVKNAAETRFWKHIAMAIVDGVSAGVAVAATAISIGATTKMRPEEKEVQNSAGQMEKVPDPKAKAANARWQSISTAAHTISQATDSGQKAINNVIQGTMELKAAEYDALKEVLQTFRQIMQMQADRGQDAFKQNSDLITQLIQQIDAMGQKIAEAQAKALTVSKS